MLVSPAGSHAPVRPNGCVGHPLAPIVGIGAACFLLRRGLELLLVFDRQVELTGQVLAVDRESLTLPLICDFSVDSTTQPASRSKRIVPDQDSIFRSLLVTFSGFGASGSMLYLTSMRLARDLVEGLVPPLRADVFIFLVKAERLTAADVHDLVPLPGFTGPGQHVRQVAMRLLELPLELIRLEVDCGSRIAPGD